MLIFKPCLFSRIYSSNLSAGPVDINEVKCFMYWPLLKTIDRKPPFHVTCRIKNKGQTSCWDRSIFFWMRALSSLRNRKMQSFLAKGLLQDIFLLKVETKFKDYSERMHLQKLRKAAKRPKPTGKFLRVLKFAFLCSFFAFQNSISELMI